MIRNTFTPVAKSKPVTKSESKQESKQPVQAKLVKLFNAVSIYKDR